MKTISKIIVLLFTILPISLFAHGGHVHTGTFWENAVHFILTNSYIAIPFIILAYFLTRMTRKAKNVKIK